METTMPDYPKDVTFEKVWAMFQETDRQMKETDRRIQKTDELVEKLSKNVGGLNRSMGELVETLIAARLWEKFRAYPFNLKRAYPRVGVYDENHKMLTDIDILLSDTEYVMAVEVKRESDDTDDVKHHVKRMGLILEHPPAEARGKKLLGAFACGVVSPEVRDRAFEAGFFVLELKGESVALLPPPEGFSPKIW